jgi:hypothetical protein
MSELTRRKFIAGAALSATGFAVSGAFMDNQAAELAGRSSIASPAADYNLMREVMKFRKIDSHVHVNLGSTDTEVQKKYAESLIDYSQRLKVEKLVLSNPVTRLINGIPDGSPESFIRNNNIVLEVMKLYPDVFLGSFTFNPVHAKESLEEIKRCVDLGMTNVKIYYQTKINDPSYYPIVEKMIDLKMIIHSHAEAQIGVGGYRMKYNGNKPKNVSLPDDFVDIARRYPEAMFQYAHISGGGDWEYMCKTLRNSPNVYVDISGSNNEENIVDFAVAQLGEDRVIFGSDNCYYQSVGKVLASNLNELQKRKIFFENFNNLLKKGGRNVD